MPETPTTTDLSLSHLGAVATLRDIADRAMGQLREAYTSAIAADKLIRGESPRLVDPRVEGGKSAFEDREFFPDDVKEAGHALACELYMFDAEPLYRASVAAFNLGNALARIAAELGTKIEDDDDA